MNDDRSTPPPLPVENDARPVGCRRQAKTFGGFVIGFMGGEFYISVLILMLPRVRGGELLMLGVILATAAGSLYFAHRTRKNNAGRDTSFLMGMIIGVCAAMLLNGLCFAILSVNGGH